jgi:hypothetical protein
MTDESNVFHVAHLVLQQHGEEALHHAAERAGEMLDAGDFEGVLMWQRILKAIDVLRAPPGPGDTIH